MKQNNILENTVNFPEESYKRHANWYNSQFPDIEKKRQVLLNFKNYKGTIHHWLQNLFFENLQPLLGSKNKKWVTVGDAYGHDANYLLDNEISEVIATDLNTDFLELSKEIGLIDKFEVQNAEKLSYDDSSIDYILCKESYHHFPRPYAALYDMLRVCREAVIIIEPQDPILRMPYLLGLSNIINRIDPSLLSKIWKNKISYEQVGNFVYKVSEREFEKAAAGFQLPIYAIKEINPNFWFPESNQFIAKNTEPQFRKLKRKKWFRDLLSKTGILPYQTICIILFKKIPREEILIDLKKYGYRIVNIKKNPYRNI